MSYVDLEFLPDSVPLHFRLDVACLKLGAAEGRFAKANVEAIPVQLEKEWKRLRSIQEARWATKTKDGMHFELVRAAQIHNVDEGAIHQRITSGMRGMLRECIRVERLQLGPTRELTNADLDDFCGRLLIEAIVDLAGDPLMHDLNFVGQGRSTKFKLLFEVYERYLQAPDSSDSEAPTCELRFAHIAHYDYVLLFPPRPHAKCALPEPDKHESVAAAFPVDTDILDAMFHQEKMVAAHATLTFLFWQCFNAVFPIDGSLKGSLEKTPMFLHRVRQKRLRDCVSREEALEFLWSIMHPVDFRMPFHRTVKVMDGPLEAVTLQAVQVAIHEAAQELEAVHPELMPMAWNSVPANHGELHWPLVVLSSSSGRDPSGHSTMDGGLRHMKPLVPLKGALACLDYSAVLRTEVQDMAMEEESHEVEDKLDEEDKDMSAVLDLSHLEDSGEVTVMQMTGTGHREIQEAIELMAQLEECILERSDKELMWAASHVAYGLRALQRASIKQQLRDVGLTVMEVLRPVQTRPTSNSICSCCSIMCTVCRNWICCRRQRSSISSKVVPDDSLGVEMRRIMFVSAPDHVLQQRAEMHKMVLKVCPNRYKTFIGGFTSSQFLRKAPVQDYWVEISTDPYPYRPYFAPSLPSADPASILSPAERKYLVRSFISDPLSELRFPDGAIDPRRGGADMDPSELVSEDILDGFLCLGSTLLGNHLVEHWILRWRRHGIWDFLRTNSLFRVPSKVFLLNFGPQIASYFEFLSFLTQALLFPALLGCFALYAGKPNMEADGSHPFWKYVQPIFSLVMVLWGTIFCVCWRRRAATLGYLWNNGITRIGEEVHGSTDEKVSRRFKDLRVEFAMKFRKDFERASQIKQEGILNGLRRVLRVSSGVEYLSEQNNNGLGNNPPISGVGTWHGSIQPSASLGPQVVTNNISRPLEAFQSAFGNKQMKADIDAYLEVCYVPLWERRRRMFFGGIVTAFFVGLCFTMTWLALRIAKQFEEDIDDDGEQAIESKLLSYVVSGVFSGLLIPCLNLAHRKVALSFTDWEAYRTIRDFQASVFYKLFFFEFINYFNGLFWVAFSYRNMTQLRVQVASIMITMCVVGNCRELIMPMIMQDVKRVSEVSARCGENGSEVGGALGRSLRQVSDQWDRPDDFLLVDEVIELVLQFGMVTMFAVAFPGLPMVWLLSTLLELRVDAYKFLRLLKTPEPCFSLGIGVAYHAFQLVAVCSLFVNSALLMFTRYTDDAGNVLEGTGVQVQYI